jgi:hypothetical protein
VPAWTYFDSPGATKPMEDYLQSLETRCVGASRNQILSIQRDAAELRQFVEAHDRLKTSGSAPANFLSPIRLAAALPASRFFEGKVGGWSCVYWLHERANVGVALFSFRSQSFRAIESLLLSRSVLISAGFRFLEQMIILWLREKGVTIT